MHVCVFVCASNNHRALVSFHSQTVCVSSTCEPVSWEHGLKSTNDGDDDDATCSFDPIETCATEQHYTNMYIPVTDIAGGCGSPTCYNRTENFHDIEQISKEAKPVCVPITSQFHQVPTCNDVQQ